MFKISGLDELTRELDQAQRALKSLDGTLTTVKFDPDDRLSVEAAIKRVEREIDRRVAPYRNNALVRELVTGMKKEYRAGILKEAAKAPRQV